MVICCLFIVVALAVISRCVSTRESHLCSGKVGLFRHPQRCHQYIQCFNGELWVRSCPVGLQFNPDTRYCDWKYNVKCQQTEDTIQTQPSTYCTEGQTCFICPNCDSDSPIVCPNHVTYFEFPDWTNCSSYYTCTFGLLAKSTCPDGLHYDFFNWRCIYPQQATCFL